MSSGTTVGPVHRVMGTEVEYGITVPSNPQANSMVASSQVVNAYAGVLGLFREQRPQWDFDEETPLRDARGYDLALGPGSEYFEPPDDELGLANVILPNGARLYVDHAHPEYSAPETTNPRDAVAWDKAGERVMLLAAEAVAQTPGLAPVQLYKNNTDGKGASYGTHENYLVPRATPFGELVRHLTPFFVSRQVVVGSGRVGIGADGRDAGFQLSQRADFVEAEVGLETTLKRPIINTRDEPHADPEKYRRLHVIIGDANLSEIATYLKLGTTSVVLAMIEDGFLPGDLQLDKPVAAVREISHDPTLRRTVRLTDGRRMTGVDIQQAYLEHARKYVTSRYGSDVDPMTADVLDRWESLLGRLESDPMQCSRELDWVAKLSILEAMRDRENLKWSAAKLRLVDLQYSDVRTDKGLYNRLLARGAMDRLSTEETVAAAVSHPPEDTRAYFRGEAVRRYGVAVTAASWDSVIFDVGGASLQRVPMLEPLRGSKAHVSALLESSPTAEYLVARLTGSSGDNR